MNALKHQEITQQDLDLYFFYRYNGIRDAFFKRYFNFLAKSRTNIEAFNSANDEHFILFGDYRYSSYNSFGINLKKYLNQ